MRVTATRFRGATSRDKARGAVRALQDVTGRDRRDVTVRADVIMHAGDAYARTRRARGAAPHSPCA